MSTAFKKTLLAAGLALAAASLCAVPSAFAAPKKTTKAKAAKAKPVHEENSIPDGPDADITDTLTTDYNCELGTKLTIFTSEKDDSHIALRWKKRIHRLDKVGTTTGALRFENTTFGLIWIGIPSKGMLLDAKLNRQLANECKNAEQERGDAPVPVEKQTEQPSTKVKVKVEPILPPLAPAPKGELPAPAAPVVPVTAPVTAPVDATPAATPAVAAPTTTPVQAAPASPPAVTPPATTPATAAPATPALVPAPATPVVAAPAPAVVPAPAATPVAPAATPVAPAATPVAPAAAPVAPAAATPPGAPAPATPPVEAAPVVPAPAATPAAAPAKPI